MKMEYPAIFEEAMAKWLLESGNYETNKPDLISKTTRRILERKIRRNDLTT